jgi:hypothetical protein
MASELRVNTLKDASGNNSVAVSTVFDGTAKAYAKCTATTSIDDSYNVSGGTDNGTGDYTYAFTNNMANGNYIELTNTTFATLSSYDTGELATSSYNVRTYSRNDSFTAIDDVNVSHITGDLA